MKELDTKHLYRICNNIQHAAAMDFPNEVEQLCESIIDMFDEIQDRFDILEERITKLEQRDL